ncbi:MAG: LacI family transcriptional regulator [Bacteroidales bacterium]|nr:LacI family transcriptional regulator [Bacteroidales bacterium]
MMPTTKQNLSLNDIALALGVSKATVSWVLSGKGDAHRISESTQRRVKEYASAHNYHPNMLAQGLSLGVTKTVGLLISSLTDPFYSSIAKSVVEEAERYGFTVMIATSESNCERESTLVASLARRRVDGIISTPTEGAQWLEGYLNGGGKLVLLDRPVPGKDAPFVGVDNEQSSYALVRHLIGKGLRRIAIMTTAHNLVNMQSRQKGYMRALSEAGIPLDEKLICNVPPQATVEQIDAELDKLMRDAPDLDGIFFTSHVLVLPVYVRFISRGIDPKKGANWACIHSLPEFDLLLPEISIAQMSISKLGSKAMDMLIEKMEGGEDAEGQSVVINCELTLR